MVTTKEIEHARAVVPQQLPCEVCVTEIPVSEAVSEEATDYVVYFCGLDCFDQWSKQVGQRKE